MLKKLLNLSTLTVLSLISTANIAQSNTQETVTEDNLKGSTHFIPPSDNKQPQRTTTGGRRGNPIYTSSSFNKSLIAIAPKKGTGLTIEERPTLLVYLPKTSAKKIVLTIVDEKGNHHSQIRFKITGKSGIISLRPSDNASPLEVGKTYKWMVVLIQGEQSTPNDLGVYSWIKRVEQKDYIAQNSLLKQGIWYSLLDSLIKARSIDPNNENFKKTWTKVLNSEGLEEISTEPLNLDPLTVTQ